jgi:hypothetical protein
LVLIMMGPKLRPDWAAHIGLTIISTSATLTERGVTPFSECIYLS